MNRTHFLALLFFGLTLTIMGCARGICTPDRYTCTIQTGKQLQVSQDTFVNGTDTIINQHISVVDGGENLLFVYDHVGDQCNGIYDDEHGEMLYFEIAPDLESFEYTDTELVDIKCYLQPTGAWVGGEAYLISEGRLKGTKQSNGNWEVELDVQATNTFYDASHKGTFK